METILNLESVLLIPKIVFANTGCYIQTDMSCGELIDIDSDSVKKFKSVTEQYDEFIQNIDKLEKIKKKLVYN